MLSILVTALLSSDRDIDIKNVFSDVILEKAYEGHTLTNLYGRIKMRKYTVCLCEQAVYLVS